MDAWIYICIKYSLILWIKLAQKNEIFVSSGRLLSLSYFKQKFQRYFIIGGNIMNLPIAVVSLTQELTHKSFKWLSKAILKVSLFIFECICNKVMGNGDLIYYILSIHSKKLFNWC